MPTPVRLQETVERELHCRARLIATEPVSEEFDVRPPWVGVVHHFVLEGHATADLAYAWSTTLAGSEKPRHTVVLRDAAVVSAADAVRKSVLADGASRR